MKLGWVLAITLAIILAGHVGAAFAFAGLYPHSWYAVLAALYIVLAGQLAFASFCLGRKQAGSWRLALSRSLIVVASFCLLLGFADLGIMVFQYDTSGLGGIQCFTHANWHKRFARSNQLGYWERDLSAYLAPRRPDRELVIAAVGDSWTWGQGVHGKERRFTNVLEAELRSRPAGPVTVLNFGVAGADSKRELAQLKDAGKVQPDVVLIGYLANDIDGYARMDMFSVQESPLCRRLALLTPTVNFIYWRTLAPRAYAEFGKEYVHAVRQAFADPAVMGKHLDDIEALIVATRAINAKPVVAILPFPAMWVPPADGSASTSRHFRDEVYGKIARKVRSLGVAVIETQKIEDEMSLREFQLNPMDNHPSEAAHRRIAQVLAEELTNQGLLAPEPLH